MRLTSNRELARQLGVSDTAVRGAEKAGRIRREADGSWDLAKVRAAWSGRRGVGGRRISPSTFPEHRFGPLRFVPRPSGPSLLVVDGLRASFSRKSGELRGFRRASDRARRTGAA